MNMQPKVFACRADDELATAAQIVREHRVRRLPVVDVTDRPIGVVSLDDLAHASHESTSDSEPGLSAAQLGEVYHATSGRSTHPRLSQGRMDAALWP